MSSLGLPQDWSCHGGLGAEMPDKMTVVAIVLMALTTYATRVSAYLLLRNRAISPRAMAVLRSSPGCVMLAFIAPFFASGHPADLLALLITMMAAIRFSMPLTVIIGVVSAAIFRHLLY